jgi:hypothetical protein
MINSTSDHDMNLLKKILGNPGLKVIENKAKETQQFKKNNAKKG